MLTSARGRDILLFVMGRVDPEVAAGAFRPTAKRKFLSKKEITPKIANDPEFRREVKKMMSAVDRFKRVMAVLENEFPYL